MLNIYNKLYAISFILVLNTYGDVVVIIIITEIIILKKLLHEYTVVSLAVTNMNFAIPVFIGFCSINLMVSSNYLLIS